MPSTNSRRSSALLLVAAGVVVGLALGELVRRPGHSRPDDVRAYAPDAREADRVATQTAPRVGAGAGPADFAAIARATVPGVTNISAERVARTAGSPFASDPFFRFFFGDENDFFYRIPQEERQRSLGSGVIVSKDGYIITNYHVLGENVREIDVTVPARRVQRARLIAYDRPTDIAILKVSAAGLPTIPWGDSSRLQVGEWVLAIGNPFQLNQTVTAGIVSAVGRANVGIADYEDFIQTDAAINPGNSGGALVNVRGELVGINTAILSQSGGYQGIGFAVPSNLARTVMDQLLRYGEVRRGSIGYLEVATVTEDIAAELGLREASGVVITKLRRGTPADRAGLAPGDVIVAIDTKPVDNASQFLRELADAKIGSSVHLRVRRNGRARDIKVPVVSAGRR